MLRMNSISESTQIVRTYSFEVEERLPPERDAHALAHILAQHQGSRDDARDPWRSFFESSFDSDGYRYEESVIIQPYSSALTQCA